MDHRNLPPGTVLGGDFFIERRLAKGGMGTVYVCEQRSTGLRRALKAFSAEFVVDDDLRRRFVQESRIGAQIDSDHIASVTASGVEANRLPWLAMELLDGETLADRLARGGPLDRAAARALFQQLGHALVAAHRVRISHRDLKPENVFIARSRRAGEAFTVKVLDFGIAKVHDAISQKTTSMTFGTPLWMAPEQGVPGAAGLPSDVWALGLLAFTALTGRTYWRAANTAPSDLGAVVQERLTPPYTPPTLRARELGAHAPLPAGFDAWFSRCVALRAADRFETIEEALSRLDAMLAVSAIPDTVTNQPSPLAFAPTIALHAPTERITAQTSPAHIAAASRRRGRTMTWVAAGLGGLSIALITAATLLRAGGAVPDYAAPPDLSRPQVAAPRPENLVDGCPEDMARIAGGRVQTNDRNVFNVPPFCLDRREVTVAAYAACVHAGGCAAIARMEVVRPLGNVCNARLPAGRDDHPINCVKRVEAERYCAWRGRRLPRSSEWELAAEGIPVRTWPWGEAPADRSRLNACGLECPEREGTALNYSDTDDWPATAPVGSFPAGATPEGVMDLLGNVSEWVTLDLPDPRGREAVRGTGFLDGPAQSTRALRPVAPDYVGRTIGIRCAR